MTNLLKPQGLRKKPKRRDGKDEPRRRYSQSSGANKLGLANPGLSACLLESQPELARDVPPSISHNLSTRLQEHRDHVERLRVDTDIADNDVGAVNTSELSWFPPVSRLTQVPTCYLSSTDLTRSSCQPLSGEGSPRIMHCDTTMPMSVNTGSSGGSQIVRVDVALQNWEKTPRERKRPRSNDRAEDRKKLETSEDRLEPPPVRIVSRISTTHTPSTSLHDEYPHADMARMPALIPSSSAASAIPDNSMCDRTMTSKLFHDGHINSNQHNEWQDNSHQVLQNTILDPHSMGLSQRKFGFPIKFCQVGY